MCEWGCTVPFDEKQTFYEIADLLIHNQTYDPHEHGTL